ncbi:MAG TPA: beta-ketoacyl-[acyl-carrier-protein] synthase family protein [Bacteroidota bacterium]|nr:beta-ketoacyl-[acyl-carrier-protein] synthase family protein [Bacteroidota bacterium]
MEHRRVVITGLGAITPIGHGKDGLWEGVRSGKNGVRCITRFDTSQIRTKVAGEVADFDPLNFFDSKSAKRMDRFAQLALAAASMAIEDAGIVADPKHPQEKIGVTFGTALGGIAGAEIQHERYVREGIKSVDPNLALTVFGGAGSSNIAIHYGFTGPSNANSNSCSSGAIAIGEAYRYIRDGYADMMIAGAAEAPLYELTFSAFTIIRSMTTNPDPATACRPFDLHRDGFVMGEASAVLVLEELGSAVCRNARIYAELLGYACNNDAFHLVQPRPDGESAARVMKDALADAKILASDVDYINAHASGTILNDKCETIALKKVFGDSAARIPVSGTKAMHAHALGATGAVEAVICSMIFGERYIPPTINLSTPDPACDLDCVPNVGREADVDHVLSNSFGFGGINAALVFGRYKQ